jgi:hypothetical protein
MGNDRADSVVSEARLRELYAARLAAGRPASAGCPAAETLQALVRREGTEEQRLETLDHVMSCAACRADFDPLRSIEGAGRRLGATGGTVKRSWVVPAALAATLLIAVGLGRLALDRTSDDDLVRAGPERGAVTLLSPPADAKAGVPLTFSWRPVPGARRYRLEVLNAAGDVALEAETTDTVVESDLAGQLAAGEYQWWVTALVSPASRRSDLRPLRLTQ